jgi:hypothetical protein
MVTIIWEILCVLLVNNIMIKTAPVTICISCVTVLVVLPEQALIFYTAWNFILFLQVCRVSPFQIRVGLVLKITSWQEELGKRLLHSRSQGKFWYFIFMVCPYNNMQVFGSVCVRMLWNGHNSHSTWAFVTCYQFCFVIKYVCYPVVLL